MEKITTMQTYNNYLAVKANHNGLTISFVFNVVVDNRWKTPRTAAV